jgi:hypothetical protein
VKDVTGVIHDDVDALPRAFPSGERPADVNEWKTERQDSICEQDVLIQVFTSIKIKTGHTGEKKERRDRCTKSTDINEHSLYVRYTNPYR